ncbi:hypothetical protein D9758_015211 [Tetrapyrgos nigripes]|uniref:Uncharacterized protein n=1 Tax=Tetrapyrgos nigripes TaxID=182062 RepID=A0A8H5CJZ3_9AGAR|nr:hypothetical protein D9758_015211 [Tetrapyrgos nigripes]
MNRYLALVGTIPVTVVKFSRMSTNASVNSNRGEIPPLPFDSELVPEILFLLDHLEHLENYGSICMLPSFSIILIHDPSIHMLALAWAASLCWRIYALYERSRRILVIMVVTNLLFTGVTLGSDPLIALLFRDRLAGLITYYAYTTEPLLTFTFNFSGIMVSRMILNLHKSVDKGILSPQRLIDIDFVSTMPWSESRDLELETVSSLRRRNGRASRSIILDDEILQIERDN